MQKINLLCHWGFACLHLQICSDFSAWSIVYKKCWDEGFMHTTRALQRQTFHDLFRASGKFLMQKPQTVSCFVPAGLHPRGALALGSQILVAVTQKLQWQLAVE